MRRCALVLALSGVLAVFAACGGEAARQQRAQRETAPLPSGVTREDAVIGSELAALRREEGELRARTDFAALAPSNRAFGANPYALAVVRNTPYFVGILRGDSRVVLLDEKLRTVSSRATVASPSALATAPDGSVFVAGPLGASIDRFVVRRGELEPSGALALPNGVVVRGLAADEKSLVVLDFVGDRLLSLPLATALTVPAGGAVPPIRTSPHVTSTCQGPFRLALSARHLAVACLFDHAIAVFARDASGAPTRQIARITHDGPLWSVALLERGDELFIGTGGVEDRPLERRDRVFGYIDSFAYLYRLKPDGSLARQQAVNTSELGVVLPKAVTLRERDGAPELLALGYATAPLVALTPSSTRIAMTALPGCNELVTNGERLLCPNPLFDAWVELTPSGPLLYPARAAAPSDPDAEGRLGEALFFTTLMAPDARSDGRLSRFTCETCHFEGATDGRVHDSGRHAFDSPADVRVSTRQLFGLFNDAPLFSRAHDRDLTSVCNNEFTVVNRGNPVDPWFSLDTARFPWLHALGERRARLSPSELRRALFRFLARFTHEENPFVAAHEPSGRFTPRERRGAELFRERCERCHAARLVANDPVTLVPFERWETLVFSPATPIVWARGDYEKTGVLPYVDREGTRIPSLRRLYSKRPYFTNGSARSLADVLERARFSADGFVHAEASPLGVFAAGHAEASPSVALDEAARLALLDFLRLL
ncbi:MAG TPA: hypothetical protein VLJ38_16095 [Polyangiaceae bacterium]|nr:hypothetical protein [Polyangiaceae bacterium]